MTRRRAAARGLAGVLSLAGLCGGWGLADMTGPAPQELDAPYEVTHVDVVRAMLTAAGASAKDTVFDLGCGDGRFVIIAAREFGARGVGVDLDPQRVREAQESAAREGVADRTEFRVGSILATDLRPATVVTIYISEEFNILLRPKLFRELAPGARVATHAFRMGEWEPDRALLQPKARCGVAYLWTVPAPVGGVWRWTARAGAEEVPLRLALEQQFQAIGGTMNAAGAQPACLTQATVAGKELTVAAKVVRKGQEINILCRGTVEGDTVRGVQQWQDGSDVTSSPWTAKRESVDPFGRWQVRPQSRKDLEGTLAIDPRGGDAGPTYVPAGGGKELALPAFYLWGSSIRFEVPSQGKPVIFTGVLDADAARGTFCKQGWPQDLAWSARRVGDRKTLPPAVPAGVYPPGRAPAAPVPVPEAAPSAAGPSSAAPLRPSASPPRRTMPTAAESPPMTPAAPPASPRPIQPRRWNPAMGEPQPGDEHVNAKDGSVLVWIPGGTFLMGGDADNDEQPVHPVKVDGFWLGKFEVTNRQYAQFLAEQPYGTQAPFLWDDPRYHGPDQPAVGVTMMDAAAYCRWAGLQLPTEAQWEYAAAGGGQLKYPTANGEISHDLANIQGTDGRDQWEFTSPVGSFPPNPFGLYDMAGNAWEWTSSKFAPYPYSPTDGREDPTIKAVRVLRGGCWHFPSDYCRTAYRHRFHDHLQYEYGGFRIMMPGKSK